MPKTAVQTPICDICGADVREGSQFCYNCGGSLSRPEVVPVQSPPPPSLPAPVARSNGTPKNVPADKREARPRRNVDRGPVEVVWQPREGVSLGYVIVGVILLILAIILLIAAMWLK